MTPQEKSASLIKAISNASPEMPSAAQAPLTIVLIELFTVSEALQKIEKHLGQIAKASTPAREIAS